MPNENDQNLPENPEEQNDANGADDFEQKLESKFKAFEDKFNSALNGVVKKLEKRLSNTVPEKPPESKNNGSDNNEPELNTIQALKAEMEKTRREFEQQLEIERAERDKDKRQVFLATVESKISKAIASQGFDDPETAMMVFSSMYSIDKWHPGASGYVIYKQNDDDDGKTLDALVKEWAKSPVGKRFINKNLPNGSGSDEPNNPAKKSKDTGAKSFLEKRKDVKENGFNLKL
ncbi:hypothetical protein ELBI_5 [Anabaena phage Elbi]|nr:hypothetical protein ELBI_5 [Anabaena phage Elbi]